MAQLANFVKIASEQGEGAIAILQQFLDEVKDEQEQKFYSIFHQSFREYLLDRKHNYDFWCDAKEQHENIIEYFKSESKDWQELNAIEQYGLRHLAQHLVQGDRTEELHMLLGLERNDRNAWFDAKDISSYQTDIRLAWEQTVKESLSAKTIALQFRYTLITASLNSLATQIPIELLVAAVQYKQWSPEKGISYALQIPEPQQKIAALTQLSTSLPIASKTQLLQIVIKMLPSVGDEKYRTEALIELISKLTPETPELLSQTLDFILSIENGNCLKKALSELVPRLDPELLSKALKIFFTTEPYRIEILSVLSPHLDKGNLWSTAFESIPSIQDNKTRADALLELAQELPLHPIEETWWTEIFKSILSILDGESRSKALAFLAPTVPTNYLESALEIVLTTWYFPESKLLRIEYDSQALEAIAPRLSPELISKVLDIEEFKEYINADIENFKLNISERITQNLLTRLNKTLDEMVDLYTWNLSEKTYTQAISTLAPYLNLTSNLFPQVVETLRDNCIDEDLAEALTAIVPYYSKALEPAYAAAQRITNPASRAFALIELVPYLPNTTLKVLEKSFEEIDVPEVRQIALNTLIPYLPKAFLHTLQAITQIEDELSRISAIHSIKMMEAERISLEYLPLILKLSLSFERSEKWQNIQSIRAEVLIHFLPYLPELFPFTWDAVLSIDGGHSFTGGVRDEDSRVLTTRKFISAIPSELIPHALDMAIEIDNGTDAGCWQTQEQSTNDYEKAFILEMLAPRLTSNLLPKALKAALGIVKFENRELVLSALACALPESFPLELEILKIRNNSFLIEEDKCRYELQLRAKPELSIFNVALAPFFPGVIFCYSDSISPDRDKASLLKSVACHLNDEYLIRAIGEASKINNTEDKIDTLLELAKHLKAENRHEILKTFHEIQPDRYRSQALTDLIPLLPENLFEEVYSIAISIMDYDYRLPVLVALIPHIPEALPKALEAISVIRDEYEHTETLIALSSYLPDILPKALETALTINKDYERTETLIKLVSLHKKAVPHAFEAILKASPFNICFSDYLKVLVPHFDKDKALLSKALEAAKSMTSEQYQLKALAQLMPDCPDAVKKARKILRSEYLGWPDSETLMALLPYLPEAALDATFKISERDFLAEVLEDLAPYLSIKLLSKALDAIQTIDSDFTRARALS